MSTPTVSVLTGADNLATWSYRVVQALKAKGLADYVLSDSASKTSAKQEEVLQLLLPTLQHVRPRLLEAGWRFDQPGQDPKNLFDLALSVIALKPHEPAVAVMVKEFVHLKPGPSVSLAYYQIRMAYLKRRIGQHGCVVDDNFAIWVVINAIQHLWPAWHGTLMQGMADGHLTWNGLMHQMIEVAKQ